MAKFEEIGNKLNYNEFFRKHLLPNKPCLLPESVTSSWLSRKEWVSEDGTPNFDRLRSLFGETNVPVANCKLEQYSSHPKTEMTMSKYLDYWEDHCNRGHLSTDQKLYLKDWHFTKAYPLYKAYTTPVYFLSDWLNEFWDSKCDDDYRFVYMGPKGTWTPFHADVYRSYSWSANICGRKKWIFFPPGNEDILKDNFGQLIYDVTSCELNDQSKFPNYNEAKDERLEVIQEQGEIIFVPSGWHHQVFNLEDTISINHNWLNGCNVLMCWSYIKDNLRNVQHEIDDCRDMEGWPYQCQVILNASAGIDYPTFFELLKVVADNRIKELHKSPDISCETSPETIKNSLGSLEISTFEDGIESADHPHKVENFGVHRTKIDESEDNVQATPSECSINDSIFLSNINISRYCDLDPNQGQGYVCSDDQCEGQGHTFQQTSDSNGKMKSVCLPEFSLTVDHMLFDLSRVRTVLSDMIQNPEFLEIDEEHFTSSPGQLLQTIETVLMEHGYNIT